MRVRTLAPRVRTLAPRYVDEKIDSIVDYTLFKLENLLRSYNNIEEVEITNRTNEYEWFMENYYVGCYGVRYPDNGIKREMLFMLKRGGICGDTLLSFTLNEIVTIVRGKICLSYKSENGTITSDCKRYEERAARRIFNKFLQSKPKEEYIEYLKELLINLSAENVWEFNNPAPQYVIHNLDYGIIIL